MPTGAGEARHYPRQHHYGVAGSSGRQARARLGDRSGTRCRDYIIDLESGDSKPITPEGTSGVHLSPDGSKTVLLGPDGKWGIWTLNGSTMQAVPGLDDRYVISGWTADGASLYVALGQRTRTPVAPREPNTGKLEPWKTLGAESRIGIQSVGRPQIWHDGAAYAYIYIQVLSEAYVVKGLK